MIWMTCLVVYEVYTKKIVLIHARSYIPAVVAMVVSRLTAVPFVFDMRALWPEELITAGRLRRDSFLHRAIVAFEVACLRRAAAVVSLTNAAAIHLEQKYPKVMTNQAIFVIPTCTDLMRFVPASKPRKKRTIGVLGTVLSGWFRLDWLAAFFAVAAERDPELYFQITTRDDPIRVRNAIKGGTSLQSRLSVAPCASDSIQEVLQGQMASVMFFVDGLGKLGSSPTRMGEVLACGLPVVANDGVGDIAGIIRKYHVGVLVLGSSDGDMSDAWSALEELLSDPKLPLRCRQAAEEIFSLDAGTATYIKIYDRLTENHRPVSTKA
jgi:glycosyltransferase involved in cell wall biosynthesis